MFWILKKTDMFIYPDKTSMWKNKRSLLRPADYGEQNGYLLSKQRRSSVLMRVEPHCNKRDFVHLFQWKRNRDGGESPPLLFCPFPSGTDRNRSLGADRCCFGLSPQDDVSSSCPHPVCTVLWQRHPDEGNWIHCLHTATYLAVGCASPINSLNNMGELGLLD